LAGVNQTSKATRAKNSKNIQKQVLLLPPEKPFPGPRCKQSEEQTELEMGKPDLPGPRVDTVILTIREMAVNMDDAMRGSDTPFSTVCCSRSSLDALKGPMNKTGNVICPYLYLVCPLGFISNI